MNAQENNEKSHSENDYQYLINTLRLIPQFEKCSEEELRDLAADIKELSLLLYHVGTKDSLPGS